MCCPFAKSLWDRLLRWLHTAPGRPTTGLIICTVQLRRPKGDLTKLLFSSWYMQNMYMLSGRRETKEYLKISVNQWKALPGLLLSLVTFEPQLPYNNCCISVISRTIPSVFAILSS